MYVLLLNTFDFLRPSDVFILMAAIGIKVASRPEDVPYIDSPILLQPAMPARSFTGEA